MRRRAPGDAAPLTLSTLSLPCPVLSTAAAAAKHTLPPLSTQAWPGSARAGNGSRATPQTQMLLTHSEGKCSEMTAVLSELVLQFKINNSKIVILNSKTVCHFGTSWSPISGTLLDWLQCCSVHVSCYSA